MINIANVTPLRRPTEISHTVTAKELYFLLAAELPERAALMQSRQHLTQRIAEARKLPADLPDAVEDLYAWMDERHRVIGNAYREYLAERKSGAPRRYFTNKSHALYFLKAAAPTKLADGSWLYGLLDQWQDIRFHGLIRTYLEELGDGVAGKNHVVLYEQLLTSHGCQGWESLAEEHFVQGAIQFSLAHNVQNFLPEVIGYNLGYEQLPLHLLITAFELNELGIDPYYFTLHVTVDNADTGHARKAVQSLIKLMPQLEDGGEFYRRVQEGYRLNDLGANTNSIIAAFDLQEELIEILQTRSVVGQNMHSDYCRVAGRTVNQWLTDPIEIPQFLQALETAGWIKRGEPAENSRFWRLVQGERAKMFGVFSEYEQQILSDWIAAPRVAEAGEENRPSARVLSFRARQRGLAVPEARAPQNSGSRGLFRHHRLARDDAHGDLFNPELRELEQRLAALGSKQEMMRALIGLMSPARHHNPTGLMATRMFAKLYS